MLAACAEEIGKEDMGKGRNRERKRKGLDLLHFHHATCYPFIPLEIYVYVFFFFLIQQLPQFTFILYNAYSAPRLTLAPLQITSALRHVVCQSEVYARI